MKNFEIAIYNGWSEDSTKIINSIKAAYLYADKVRVYDLINHDFTSEGVKGIIDLLKEDPQNRETIEKYKQTLNKELDIDNRSEDNLDNSYFRILDLMYPNMKFYGESLYNVANNVAKNRMIYHNYSYVADMIQSGRDEIEQGGYKEYQKNLEKMHIEIIEPAINRNIDSEKYLPLEIEGPSNLISLLKTINTPEIVAPLTEFRERYTKDSGVKLLNDTTFMDWNRVFTSSMANSPYLSEQVISRLPGFENATVDEIIDIRAELEPYIIPYRGAILKMSEEIKDIPDAESLQEQCKVIYFRDIEPKVAAINAAIEDNNVIKNIAMNLFTEKETWVGISAIAAAVAAKSSLAGLIEIGSAVTIGGLSIARGIKDTLEENKKIKGNELYFLYEMGERLDSIIRL